jgi:hypothetical protein
MDNTILSLDELKSRITSFYQEKKASAAAGGNDSGAGDEPSETDPQETTPPTPVKDDGDDANLLVVPDQALSVTNTDGAAENNIPGQGKNDGNKGEASGAAPGVSDTTEVTADMSKQKEDEAVSDPVTAKVATQGLTLAERIKDRLMGKSAAEEKEDSKEDSKKEKGLTAEQSEELPEALKDEIKKGSSEEVASDFDMNPDAYRKIASLVLGYEEGRELLDRLADREMGKQAAQQLIVEAEQLGAEELRQEQAQSQEVQYIQKLASTATEEEFQAIRKIASVHNAAFAKYSTSHEQKGYDFGTKQAAAAMDEGDGMIPGDTGEAPSIEEIAEMVMALVEAGEIDPQTAELILAEIAGGAGGAEGGMPPGAEGGMPASEEEAMAMAAGGGEVPPEAMAAMGGDPKMASAVESLSKVASVVDGMFEAQS